MLPRRLSDQSPESTSFAAVTPFVTASGAGVMDGYLFDASSTRTFGSSPLKQLVAECLDLLDDIIKLTSRHRSRSSVAVAKSCCAGTPDPKGRVHPFEDQTYPRRSPSTAAWRVIGPHVVVKNQAKSRLHFCLRHVVRNQSTIVATAASGLQYCGDG